MYLSDDERETTSLGLAHGQSLRMLIWLLVQAPSTLNREYARITMRGCLPEQMMPGRLWRASPDDMRTHLSAETNYAGRNCVASRLAPGHSWSNFKICGSVECLEFIRTTDRQISPTSCFILYVSRYGGGRDRGQWVG